MKSNELTVHSRFNRIVAVILWVLSVVLVVIAASSGDQRLLWVYPTGLFLVAYAYFALWRPNVTVSDEGVLIQNVTHHIFVPWVALILVDTKHALTLYTPGKKFTAWSAPAPGLVTAYTAGRRAANRETRAAGQRPRHADLIGTDSGDAAIVIRERWEKLKNANRIAIGEAGEVTVRRVVEPLPLLVLPVLAAGIVAGFFYSS